MATNLLKNKYNFFLYNFFSICSIVMCAHSLVVEFHSSKVKTRFRLPLGAYFFFNTYYRMLCQNILNLPPPYNLGDWTKAS